MALARRPSSPVNYGPFEAVLKIGARIPLRAMPVAAASARVSLLIDVRGPGGRCAFCSRLVLLRPFQEVARASAV
jgi:hypothetical protein